jgi:hypothetical protein
LTGIKLPRPFTGETRHVNILDIWRSDLNLPWFDKRPAAYSHSCCSDLRSADAPRFTSKRLQREHRTMTAMVLCYCQDHHRAEQDLCPTCQGLLDYATLRLERCRFGENKPTCANCPVHCYQAKRREEVKLVMRYAGPRMLWKHPLLAVRHILDGCRKAPPLAER